MVMFQVTTSLKICMSSNSAVMESANTEYLGYKCNIALSAAVLTFETNSKKMKSKAVFLKQKPVHVKCQGFLL